jgi:hypothetical protein
VCETLVFILEFSSYFDEGVVLLDFIIGSASLTKVDAIV